MATRRESWGKVRQLASKRWQASYVGPDGARHTARTEPDADGVTRALTFSTKTDARAWLRAEHAKIALGDWQSAADRAVAAKDRSRRNVTFATYAETWISGRFNKHGHPLRPRTASEYRRLVAGPLGPLGPLPLASIDRATVDEWRAAQLRTGHLTTTGHAYALLRSILATATVHKMIPENPATIEHGATTRTGKKVTPPTIGELDVIVANLPHKYRALFLMAAWSGLRIGELTALTRADITVTKKAGAVTAITLNVDKGVTWTETGPHVGPPKTSSGVRTVTLPPVEGLYTAVVAHLAEFVAINPDALVFANTTGGHLRQPSVQKVLKPAREKAGRPDVSLHSLRHFHASWLHEVGASPAAQLARLGQNTSSMIGRYSHPVGEDAALAAALADRVNSRAG
ncbi:tyrosine-type recombinase/integrase [Microbacterium sp. B2969]|uniref:Tyrosine-type recombinase/integrase n=1 Tax=Microbacterium alkaliflavum TaxID=3248839 RepID=A0ABW7QDI1_9MICO